MRYEPRWRTSRAAIFVEAGPRPRTLRGAAAERGFALVAVAITIAALSLMLVAVGDAARGHVRAIQDSSQRLKLTAAIDGALATVASQLAGTTVSADLFVKSQSLSIGNIAVSVSVRPEAAKVDLNAAPAQLLTDLLRSVTGDSERAGKLSDAILDWRDADSFANANGAEAADYINAGLRYVPANRNFESVAELALVLGANPNLVTCLASDITVFTNQTNVDADYASLHVRKALGLSDVRPATEVQDDVGIQPGVIFEVAARAEAADGTVISRATTVRFTGSPKNPIWILGSASPAPDPATSEAACRAFAAASREVP